jgi:cell division protease FtsH
MDKKNELDLVTIEKRELKLEEARASLKTQFIGIDEIIDKFIDSVKLWYVIPEIQSRPLIINLWGITGVGKTDLVRKFIKAIEFTDRFTEIQMDSKDGSATIEDYLDNTFESSDSKGVLLLDEIQRFRTIKDNGEESSSSKFQDLWMLLSDGTFQSNAKIKQDLLRMVLEDDYWAERGDDDDDDDEPDNEVTEGGRKKKKKKPSKRVYLTSYWEASRMKKLLKLKEPMEEIMKWSKLKKMNLIKESLNSDKTYEGKKYTKLLIIISGNLDEAFHMADNVNDADRDADVYHEYSKSIDIIKIKGALRYRFKPEQIARLGNMHMIYPIPSRAAYYGIIEKKVDDIKKMVKENNGIDFTVDQSVLDVIYNNGVFPTQGVRPVLSTVSSIIENSLPKFLFEWLKTDKRGTIELTYKDGFMTSNIGGKTVKYAIPTVLDDIKEKQSEDNKALVSVHEAGHAIIYALLFKAVPTQIVATTSDEDTGGFVGTHPNIGSKVQILNNVIVSLGGRVAEELIFGKEIISKGAASDLVHATSNVGKYVRNWALDMHDGSNMGYYQPPAINKGTYLYNIEVTDDRIEEILRDKYSDAVKLIKDNNAFLLEVADELMEKSTLTQKEFQVIAKKHMGETISIIDAGQTLDVNYKERLDTMLKNKR